MKLTMSCDIESRRSSPDRRAAWHVTCWDPTDCRCPGHKGEAPRTAEQVLAARWRNDGPRTRRSGL